MYKASGIHVVLQPLGNRTHAYECRMESQKETFEMFYRETLLIESENKGRKTISRATEEKIIRPHGIRQTAEALGEELGVPAHSPFCSGT